MANANDRRQVQDTARREKGARKGELESVRYLMAAPIGRALAARLLEHTGTEGVVPFSNNAMSLSRDVGVQSVGFWLLAEIRAACPEQELIMRREAAERAERAAMQEELDDGRD